MATSPSFFGTEEPESSNPPSMVMTIPNDPPLNMREACRTPAYATALSQLLDRVGGHDVTDDLVESGLDHQSAARVVRHSKKLLDDAKSGPGSLLIGTGAF